jgi:hypothetical protein
MSLSHDNASLKMFLTQSNGLYKKNSTNFALAEMFMVIRNPVPERETIHGTCSSAALYRAF